MLPLKLFTLGGFTVLRGDAPVRGFVSRKVDALLVYLAHERHEHQREFLATLLWSDLAQERALGNLRTALSNLSTQLKDYLIITRQTVMLRPDADCWVDSLALRDALKRTETLNAASAAHLSDALSLYRGSFLAGFHLRDSESFEEWRAYEADVLQTQVLSGLQRLVKYALDSHQYDSGIEHARRAIAIDPLHEEAHRGLMLLLARVGQRRAALAQYETCVQLLRDELGVDPEPETTALFERLRSETMTAAPVTTPAPALPIPSTPFIDRPAVLQQIADRLLDPDCRLLTILGAGGMGKTRLALQTATNVAGSFRDGVYFVPLVAVQQGEFIPAAIAAVLGFSPQGIHDPLVELTAYLSNRELLLILDNFEHLAEHADQIADILTHTPRVRILVTSRVWLNLPQEWGLPVEGMTYPSALEPDDLNAEAVRLFAACARRVSPSFSLANELPHVSAICRLVEGMPLSIELAAAWLRVIPVSEIVERLDLRFLTTSSRGVAERHRSAEAVFDYSWMLLTDAEATALMNLCVFKGMFDRDSARQVAGASLEMLASLLDKSLIRRVDDHYYSMHELLRQYGFARLVAHSSAENARDAHLAYYVEMTADPDSRIHGEQQTLWLDRLEREHDNLRTAMSWALEKDTPDACDLGLKLAASVWEFWLMRGHITEGRQWLDLLLDATHGTISEARGAATQGAGYLAWIQGESDRAEVLHREGLAIRRAIGDKAGMGGSLSNLGVVAWGRGDFAAARDFYEQALAVRREANYAIGVASVLNNLSLLMQDQSEYTEAIAFAEQAWALFEELDDLQGMLHVLYNIGAMRLDRGDLEGARSIQDEALALARQLGDQRVEGGLLLNQGNALVSLGEYDQARASLQQSLDIMTRIGDKQHLALIQRGQAQLALAENRLDEALALVEESLAFLRQPKGDVYLGQTLVTRGEILAAFGDLNGAIAVLREALSVLVKLKKSQPIAHALYLLSDLLCQQGEIEQATALIRSADSIALKFDLRFPGRVAGAHQEWPYSASPYDWNDGILNEVFAFVTALAG